MKKYEDKCNVVSNLIKNARIKKGLTKGEVCRRLQLHAVYLDITELNRMETCRMIIKDFELIALCEVLDIDYIELKQMIL